MSNFSTIFTILAIATTLWPSTDACYGADLNPLNDCFAAASANGRDPTAIKNCFTSKLQDASKADAIGACFDGRSFDNCNDVRSLMTDLCVVCDDLQELKNGLFQACPAQ